jgi:hypothetical protein
MKNKILSAIFKAIDETSIKVDSIPDSEKIEALNQISEYLHDKLSPVKQPINKVLWIPIDKVEPNDYNPNAVANKEMKLLYTSILHDGYTQPVVTIWDEEKQKYIIVDGFHRYFTCKTQEDILERNKGHLPIVVIEKDINDRMASTVRHNRARGEHSIKGMGNMVFELLQNGWTDSEICNHLGMEAEEILKLKHITGFSKLFEDSEYQKSWETKRMIKLRLEYQNTDDKQT